MKNSIVLTKAYFDCNATTPVLPAAAEAAFATMRTLYGNPSSTHLIGLQAKYLLESTRKTAAQVIGAEAEQIVFTSGATEAIQTAVFSALQHLKEKHRSEPVLLLYGATEHKVVPQALHHWTKALGLPFQVEALPVHSDGQLDLDILRKKLPQAGLLCSMAVNNETGVIHDLPRIEALLKELRSEVLWLVDCVQALGKAGLSLGSSRIDYAAFSGHKLYAPKGIGFLYLKKEAPYTPLIVGGGQEKGLRSGTENLPGVAALGAVLENLSASSETTSFQSSKTLARFRDLLAAELKRSFPKILFNAPFEKSVPTTLNFSIPGLTSKELLDVFDSAGLRISAGSACNSQSAKSSHVLDAMGIPNWRSASALRLSFGPCTTESEIQKGCQIIRECAMALRTTCLLETAGVFTPPANLRDGIIQFRAGSTNSWLIAHRETRTGIVIDPCETLLERIENYIRCQNLRILAVLDTHSHADHESVRPVLQKVLTESSLLEKGPCNTLGWPLADSSFLTEVELADGTKVPAIRIHSSSSTSSSSELLLASVPTAGHTLDSQTFLLGNARSGKLSPSEIHFAFVGDTILSGGLGRTNFAISDPEAMFHSLRRIQSGLSPQTLLCPAHDYNHSFATTLETEARENALLGLALSPLTPLTLELFLKRKSEIDLELASLEENFQGIVCGTTASTRLCSLESLSLSHEALADFLSKNDDETLLIDVREPQEFSLFQDWETVGFKTAPRNVPLSRFVNFMGELVRSSSQPRVLLICRSGSRSQEAVKALRRLGIRQSWSLEGGIA